jgi:hypothetical protein
MTYLPGGRFNATISGNTAGAGAIVSSGTLTLAGGNNITLSQAGNAITISGGAAGGGSQTLGMSNLGNSAGTSGVVSGSAVRYLFAGGNNVTLSQSINGVSGTVTIVGATQTTQTQNLHNVTLSGNTSGVMAQVSSGTLTLAGGNNVTLSQNGNAVTISAASQSVQTQNLHNLTIAGNTAGAGAAVSSGTLTLAGGNNITLSQNGNAITISGGAGGGGGGIALANSQTTYTSGTANMVASGALTIASTTGQSFNFSVPQTSSFVGAGLVSLSTSGSTVSISVPSTTKSIDFYQNMDRGATAVLGTANGTLMLQRLNQENDYFAANLTANTALLNMSANLTATSASTAAHTYSVSIGVYSDNATALNLVNSASTSWAISANASNSASYNGPRWLSFVSSQWSSAPAFTQGGNYVFGVAIRSSGQAIPMSYIGQNYMISNQRSGSLGVAAVASTTLAQGNFWNGMYGTSTTAMPSVISSNQLNRNNATAIFMPHIVLNNRYSGTF